MYKYKKILFSLLLLFLTSASFAQNYEKEFESIFAWEVKQIDEFMERFNNQDKTLIKQYVQKTNQPTKDFTREKMIKSLFDAQSKGWNFEDINAFIKYTTDKPVLLNFYNQDWYAKVDCQVTWNGIKERVSLILNLEGKQETGSKWVISGVTAPFLKHNPVNTQSVPTPRDKSISLNPVSHTTDFMNIYRVTENTNNIQNYISGNGQQKPEVSAFIQACLSKKLVINNVANISYHFLQIDNWILEVKQFNRQTKNSGWLISKLITANNKDKETYRVNILKQ
jgi:hypothetical protein